MRMRIGAGWSSPVARQAHNLKVVGSNPTPATNLSHESKHLAPYGALLRSEHGTNLLQYEVDGRLRDFPRQ